MAVDHKLLGIVSQARTEHANGNYAQSMKLNNDVYEITFNKMKKLEEEIKKESENMPEWDSQLSEEENEEEINYWVTGIKFLERKRDQFYGQLFTNEEFFYKSAETRLAECD